jgi:ABC-2 type transport system ATP-binding protein
MKQKLALSVILLSSPALILLDEPTTGVDPLSRIEFFDILQELKAEGKTIALTTPYLDEAEKGDYVIFLKEGRVLVKDAIHSLIERFPARLLRIVPQGSIFAALETLDQDQRLQGRTYMRGNAIHLLQPKGEAWAPPFPVVSVGEEPPGLEDIFIYYERRLSGGEPS